MDGEWDIITFHHSFEHVPDPSNVLRTVKRLLAPQGVCVLRVPTVPCWAWEHYGTNWVQLDAPRHLFLHSPDSIAVLAANSGLELFNTVYDSTRFQFSGSEKLARGVPLREREALNWTAAPKRLWEKWDHGRRAERLNREARGDQAVFYLKHEKPS